MFLTVGKLNIYQCKRTKSTESIHRTTLTILPDFDWLGDDFMILDFNPWLIYYPSVNQIHG